MKKLIVFSVVVILFMSGSCMTHITEAEAPIVTVKVLRETKEWTPSTIKTMIRFVSREYDYKYEVIDWLVSKESSYRTNVYGDSGKAYGLAQFHKPTWIYFQDRYNRHDLKIDNPVNQIEMLCLALKDGQFQHWTPFTTYKNHPPL